MQPRPWYRLAFYSLLAGSTSLIPIPFVDDWTLDWVRRRMILELSGSMTLSEEAIRVLLRRGVTSSGGCLNRLVRTPVTIVIYLIGRVFKKLVFILAIKESTDRASLIFHEGYLLDTAARRPDLHPSLLGGEIEWVRQLAYAQVETCRRTDTSPIRLLVAKTLRGSWRLLFAAARRLRRAVRKRSRPEGVAADWEAQEESVIGELSRELAQSLEDQRGYFASLEERFESFARRRGIVSRMEDVGATGQVRKPSAPPVDLE